MSSAIYAGTIRHRRHTDVKHVFRYSLFMCCLDLDALPAACRWRWPFSMLAHFKREDHLGDADTHLSEAVRDLVQRETGTRPLGRVLLLTHLRYFGYAMNPLSVYYCLNESGAQIEALVLEVNNTPWGEQHCYVLGPRTQQPQRGAASHSFPKTFHVSPFLGMPYTYHCRATLPSRSLVFHLENRTGVACDFDATLVLRRQPFSSLRLCLALLRFPMMTLQVTAGIYFEAFRLWLKGAPFHPHPHRIKETRPHER